MYEVEQNKDIKKMIYNIRGKQVMLDSDVTYLFGYEVKQLNRQVSRNIERFPKEYCFKLTKEEYAFLRCHFGTLKNNRGVHTKYLPYVFTQEGIAMLSGVIKTEEAAKVNVEIMREFVKLRNFINNNPISLANDISIMKNMLFNHEEKISKLFDKFDRKEDLRRKLFFNGEIYDAYSLLVDIIEKANNEIIIIDNYVDKVTLDILSKKNINVTVLLIMDKNKSKLTKTDIDKFNSEYPSLKIKYTNIFHDRFIIIDSKELYHLGASLKDLGKKVFGITKIDDMSYLKLLINKVKS